MRIEAKYVLIWAFGAGLVIVGALLFAAATDNNDGGDNFGRIFLGALGLSLIVVGIGTSIASAATFLARRE